MQEILRLKNISYGYDVSDLALNDVTATFYKGERIAILGRNGAGKSTFFLCCNGVLTPKSGEVFLRGHRLAPKKTDISALHQAVGLVFQEPDSQIIAGSVESEISFGPMNLGLTRQAVAQRVGDAVAQMHLNGFEQRAPQYLSGGEKKRVTIADILAMGSEMILFDEPTASLDPENVALLEKTLESLSEKGIALAVSTHDVNFACRFATRVLLFADGRLLADGSAETIFSDDMLLAQAGLKKPTLFSVFDLLEERFFALRQARKPRTLDQLAEYMSHIK